MNKKLEKNVAPFHMKMQTLVSNYNNKFS